MIEQELILDTRSFDEAVYLLLAVLYYIQLRVQHDCPRYVAVFARVSLSAEIQVKPFSCVRIHHHKIVSRNEKKSSRELNDIHACYIASVYFNYMYVIEL